MLNGSQGPTTSESKGKKGTTLDFSLSLVHIGELGHRIQAK